MMTLVGSRNLETLGIVLLMREQYGEPETQEDLEGYVRAAVFTVGLNEIERDERARGEIDFSAGRRGLTAYETSKLRGD